MAAAIATRFRHSEFQNGIGRRTCSAGSSSRFWDVAAGAAGATGVKADGFGAEAAAAGLDGANESSGFSLFFADGDAAAGVCAAEAAADAVPLPNVWHSVRNAVRTVRARPSLTLMLLSNSALASMAVAKLRSASTCSARRSHDFVSEGNISRPFGETALSP